jgi:hypothetical protein
VAAFLGLIAMKKQTTIKVTVNVAFVILAVSKLLETMHQIGLL